MSQRTSLRRQPTGMVKCYDCNGSGMAKNGVTMFETCKTCGGWGILNPPPTEQVNPKRKHRK